MNDSKLLMLVEHDPDEIFLFERALLREGIINPLTVLPQPEEAMDYLEGSGHYANRELFPVPALLILDLDFPVPSPARFLNWLRTFSNHKNLPVVGLSDVAVPERIQKFYNLGINAFFHKRLSVHETVRLIKDLDLVDELLQNLPAASHER